MALQLYFHIANILIILYDEPVFNRFFCYLFIFYVLRKKRTLMQSCFSYYDRFFAEEKEFLLWKRSLRSVSSVQQAW